MNWGSFTASSVSLNMRFLNSSRACHPSCADLGLRSSATMSAMYLDGVGRDGGQGTYRGKQTEGVHAPWRTERGFGNK